MSKLIQKHEMKLKIVFVGDSAAGKTSLLLRQTEDTFTKEYLCTIGVDFKFKNYEVNKINVKAMLWDTAGQERFRSIQKPYYKGKNMFMQDLMPFCFVLVWQTGNLSKICRIGLMKSTNMMYRGRSTLWVAKAILTQWCQLMRF